MIQDKINRLTYLTEVLPSLLTTTNDDTFKEKSNPEKWSKQEILGHLIDSAANNHQRFVRGQFEENPIISYNQDAWNKHNYYNDIEKSQLIEFWRIYNRQILELVKRIPSDILLKECNTGGQENYTIGFIFNDYVDHLEYHLKQIVKFE